MRGRGLDFSFSGLKTAVLTIVQQRGVPDGQALADLCASFQAAVVEQLVRKTRRRSRQQQLKQLQVAGGVAANSRAARGARRAATRARRSSCSSRRPRAAPTTRR